MRFEPFFSYWSLFSRFPRTGLSSSAEEGRWSFGIDGERKTETMDGV